MARKKIKLITFDLDDTVWPNHRVIVVAEKALWSFLMMKVPQVKDQLNEDNINRIRVDLIEKDNSLKFNLTKFRKEVVKALLLELGLDENEAIYYSNESFNEFFKFYTVECLKNKNTKYFIGQHGSKYGCIKEQFNTVEEYTSDSFVTWGWKNNFKGFRNG